MFFLSSSSNSSDPPLEMFTAKRTVYSEYKRNLVLLIGNYVGKGNQFIELGALQVKQTSIFMVLHAAGKGVFLLSSSRGRPQVFWFSCCLWTRGNVIC
jgi:hypothetical protein